MTLETRVYELAAQVAELTEAMTGMRAALAAQADTSAQLAALLTVLREQKAPAVNISPQIVNVDVPPAPPPVMRFDVPPAPPMAMVQEPVEAVEHEWGVKNGMPVIVRSVVVRRQERSH